MFCAQQPSQGLVGSGFSVRSSERLTRAGLLWWRGEAPGAPTAPPAASLEPQGSLHRTQSLEPTSEVGGARRAVFTDDVPRSHLREVPELGELGQGLDLGSPDPECMSSSPHPLPAHPSLLCGLGQVTLPFWALLPHCGMR